jgi:uncharacterized protein YggE
MILALALAPLALPQVSTTRRTLRAYGEGEVVVQPDQARIQIAIVTRGDTAEAASQQNATTSTAVFDALRRAIGNAGELRTSAYNVSAYFEGTPPRQAGFQVTNAILVRVNNLNITGRVIDTAIAAGATRVDSLVLGLRDDDPVRLQALRAAGAAARARAEAIAGGLGLRLGQILNVEEGVISRPVIPVETRGMAGAAVPTTPIEGGNMTYRATITVEYEITQ